MLTLELPINWRSFLSDSSSGQQLVLLSPVVLYAKESPEPYRTTQNIVLMWINGRCKWNHRYLGHLNTNKDKQKQKRKKVETIHLKRNGLNPGVTYLD